MAYLREGGSGRAGGWEELSQRTWMPNPWAQAVGGERLGWSRGWEGWRETYVILFNNQNFKNQGGKDTGEKEGPERTPYSPVGEPGPPERVVVPLDGSEIKIIIPL